jgi:uncharacterized membrane protein YjjP (DUF1212 family)
VTLVTCPEASRTAAGYTPTRAVPSATPLPLSSPGAHPATPTPLPWSRSGLPAEELADYLAEIGGTLVAYGCPSYRLEEVIASVGEVEGFAAHAFAFPTGLIVSLRASRATPPLLRMVRVKQWQTNLDRLVRVDTIFNAVAARKLSIREARKKLADIDDRPLPYPRVLEWLAVAAASAAVAVFLRGRLVEVEAAALAGLLVGFLAWALLKVPNARFLVEFFGGLVAASAAGVACRLHPGASREVIVLAGVIALIPGLTLTTALAEIARKNLVAGAGRLMEAVVGFTSILFGIALELGIEHVTKLSPPVAPVRDGLPIGFQAVALVAASLAFAVLFSVPRIYVASAILSGAIGYVATAVGTRVLPGHIAAFLAALAVCSSSNVYARVTGRPAQLFQLPGLTLLVPGSFGFLSLEAFLNGDYLKGAAQGFQMILVAAALVSGILLSSVIVPPRKLL